MRSETSGKRKLFQAARQDDERIRTRPDINIRIFDAADLSLLVGWQVVVSYTIFDQDWRNGVTAVSITKVLPS
jgi:hypothetical protein